MHHQAAARSKCIFFLLQVGGAKYEFMASSLLFSPRMYVCERATASSTLWRLQLSRASTLHSETRGQRYHYSKCITSWNYDSSGKVKIIGFKIDENPDSDGMMPWFGRYHCAGWRKLLQELLLYHNTMAYSLGKLPPFLLQLRRRCRRVDVAMAVARCCQKVQLE